MGLDMYLTKKHYIGSNYEHRNVKCNIDITINDKKVNINTSKITYIEEKAGYWRKANHIHNWFVNNIQDGDDNCATYYVSSESLKELLNLCLKVKNDHSLAPELLPYTEGFFFGGQEYNEYYFEDIDSTIQIIEDIMKDEDWELCDYYYQSSW